MARYVIGIDPGLSGALAVIDVDNLKLRAVATPTYVEKVRGKKKTQYDLPTMANLLSIPPALVQMVYIEHVSAMPGQGVTSMFRFGFGYGLWIGILAANRLPYKAVTPRAWKAHYSLGSEKDRSREVATELFPACSDFWKLKKHDGLAEAALLAHRAADDCNFPLVDIKPFEAFAPKKVLLG